MDGFPDTLDAATGGQDFFGFMSGVIDKGLNYLSTKEAADAQREANTVKSPTAYAGQLPAWVMPAALVGGGLLIAVLILKK